MPTDSLIDTDRTVSELTVQRISDRNLIARLERKLDRAREEISTTLTEASQRAEGYNLGLTPLQAATFEATRLRRGLIVARAILRGDQI